VGAGDGAWAFAVRLAIADFAGLSLGGDDEGLKISALTLSVLIVGDEGCANGAGSTGGDKPDSLESSFASFLDSKLPVDVLGSLFVSKLAEDILASGLRLRLVDDAELAPRKSLLLAIFLPNNPDVFSGTGTLWLFSM